VISKLVGNRVFFRLIKLVPLAGKVSLFVLRELVELVLELVEVVLVKVFAGVVEKVVFIEVIMFDIYVSVDINVVNIIPVKIIIIEVHIYVALIPVNVENIQVITHHNPCTKCQRSAYRIGNRVGC
jgi:hypothetical protein